MVNKQILVCALSVPTSKTQAALLFHSTIASLPSVLVLGYNINNVFWIVLQKKKKPYTMDL